MNLQAAIALRFDKRRLARLNAYGTSEGVTKAWDTRGRGRKAPPFKEKYGARGFDLPSGLHVEIPYNIAGQDKVLAAVREYELKKLPQSVQEGFARGEDTKKQNSDQYGYYSPEREAAVHNPVIADYMHGTVAQANPELVIVAGGTASGKSGPAYATRQALGNHAYLNTDDIRANLPEAGAFAGNDKQDLLQEEAGDIRDKVLTTLVQGRRNIVLDAPGSSTIAGIADWAEANGYKVSVKYVHRDVESAAQSASMRKYEADLLSDLRDVPEKVTYGSHSKARSTLPEYSAGRALEVWDRELDMQNPTVIFRRGADGKVQVYNAARIEAVMNGQNAKVPKIDKRAFTGF